MPLAGATDSVNVENASLTDRMLGNVNLFYATGRPGRRVAPNAMLWLNPPSHKSGHPYRIWIDGVPDLVVEALSAETWPNGAGVKKDAHEAMGVKEYLVV